MFFIRLTQQHDIFTGNYAELELLTLGGDDYVLLHGGRNLVRGGDGDDEINIFNWQLIAEPGAIGPFPFSGENTVFGGAGNDNIVAHGVENVLRGGDGEDRIVVVALAFGVPGEGGSVGSPLAPADRNLLVGGPGRDILSSQGSDNTLLGGADDDLIMASGLIPQWSWEFGYALEDLVGRRNLADGGAGNDAISVSGSNNEARGGPGNDSVFLGPFQLVFNGQTTYIGDGNVGRGGAGDDYLQSHIGTTNSQLYGDSGDDTLVLDGTGCIAFGGTGNDTFFLRGEAARVTGGPGADVFHEQGGTSVFVYGSARDSAPAEGRRDTIHGFDPGQDKFDFTALGPLAFIGTTAFSRSGTGEVRLAAAQNAVLVDVDGDGRADMRIDLVGTPVASLAASDFLLV